ncbi:MAG: RpiB/LacA/LacB family sugar-phosphate isomerase [Patescibacteria group bacterium]|nr:RpiB/LacA/LacB family sugar-phosphate isomerase [Patescibacteria group bacterium]
MKIFIGADHRGFELKEFLKKRLSFELEDCGAHFYDPNDDYVDFALRVGIEVVKDDNSVGILICGSGAGMCFAVNKIKGIRASVCCHPEMARKAREDDDLNMLCLASDFIDKELALEIVKSFLNSNFKKEEKYLRRLKKISEYENRNYSFN